jgi:hypothetical protein
LLAILIAIPYRDDAANLQSTGRQPRLVPKMLLAAVCLLQFTKWQTWLMAVAFIVTSLLWVFQINKVAHQEQWPHQLEYVCRSD